MVGRSLRCVSLMNGVIAAAIAILILSSCASLQQPEALIDSRTVKRWRSIDATQAVAVDADHVYVIHSRNISKINKQSGATITRWVAADQASDIRHLNSGVVYQHKLYAAHSNWPRWPPDNSIQIWNTDVLSLLTSITLPIADGWITWLDRYAGYWWVVLAQYGDSPARRARLIRLDENFKPGDVWEFPQALLDTLKPMSNSGGSWGPDGLLWLTGHDFPRAYRVALPAAGSKLYWCDTVLLPGIDGQGIAWDRTATTSALFGVNRSMRVVVEINTQIRGDR